MSTNNQIKYYQNFFGDQVREAELEQKSIIKAPISQLVRKEEILIGYIDHINEKQGHVVIKFPKNKAPRLNILKSIMVVKKRAKDELGEKLSSWTCSFLDFCKNGEYHSSTSEVLPLYYQKKSDNNYDYVGCTGISVNLFDLFKNVLAAGKSLTIMIFTPFPPVDYFNNLINYLEAFSNLPEQLLEPKIKYEDWKPEELSYNPEDELGIPNRIMKTLEEDGCCILQGPPGSGKSYTIAYIISKYLQEGRSVCATTMANKGLVELVQQPPLKPFLLEEKISKTNLSADERRTVTGLKPAKKGFFIPTGELLCSTNYVLSHAYNKDNLSENSLPNYDLVIIEEASQAFLATILAFKQLGKKCLIVGDPMQLPPIVTNPNKSLYKAWNAKTQIDGLRTFALGTETKSYRITTTFRLTPVSAKLTAIFYNNRFNSVQNNKLDFSLCPPDYFPNEGGAIYCYTRDFTNGIISSTGLSIVADIVNEIVKKYPKRSLAIISPFKETVKQLQRSFLSENSLKKLTIDTVDRIQGMTVDYAIFYLPGRYPSFALEERRFNVATSRSMSTTLIISDMPLENLHSISPKVMTFINNCKCLNRYNSIEDMNLIYEAIEKNSIVALYPGLENIVESLLANNVPFSHDGEVELLDREGVVIATAGMLLKEYKIAINPVDNDSKQIFERAGYKVITSEEFSIELLKK